MKSTHRLGGGKRWYFLPGTSCDAKRQISV